MSERKPLHQPWRSWIDEQIERAREEGAFDNLEGAGKPLEGLDEPDSPDWWLRSYLKRERLDLAPGALDLRLKIQILREELPRLRDERAARRALAAMNELIAQLNRLPGPEALAAIAPVDVEEELSRWRPAGRQTGSEG
jgi:hypothetical protein